MKPLPYTRSKWPYATHLVDPARVKGLLPMVGGYDPGALVLARVVTLGKHRELEARDGRKLSIFSGDVFVGVLGDPTPLTSSRASGACRARSATSSGSGGSWAKS